MYLLKRFETWILLICIMSACALSGGLLDISQESPVNPGNILSQKIIFPSSENAHSELQLEAFQIQTTYAPTLTPTPLPSPTPTTPDATSFGSTDMKDYINTYGFYNPTTTNSIPPSVLAALKAMTPYAIIGAAKYNARYKENVPPQIIVWWSYAEGVNGNISWSNCGDKDYSILTNCGIVSSSGQISWQLGYGIQFTAVPGLLGTAFTDTHPGENVQTVGQNVMHIDGKGKTFPNTSLNAILANTSVTRVTNDNYFASVLSRDPLINSYINAEALRVSRFNRQLAFGWSSSYQTSWQAYSNDMATILKYWPQLSAGH